MALAYRRDALVEVLLHHRPTQSSACRCGGVRLGQSWPDHLADVYQEMLVNAELDEVAERLDAIEARLREYEMHDPHCSKRATERNQRQTTMYLVPGPCTCWLSDDTEWAKCAHCGGNIFSHDDGDGGRVWSHEGGTPGPDHTAVPEAPAGFRAAVLDAGGGTVRLLVDRDTMEYPVVGAKVRVVEDGEA